MYVEHRHFGKAGWAGGAAGNRGFCMCVFFVDRLWEKHVHAVGNLNMKRGEGQLRWGAQKAGVEAVVDASDHWRPSAVAMGGAPS
jgi:hypothetical protein